MACLVRFGLRSVCFAAGRGEKKCNHNPGISVHGRCDREVNSEVDICTFGIGK
jgi:hypothetical protein